MDGTIWLMVGITAFFFWTMFVHMVTRKWVFEEIEELEHAAEIEAYEAARKAHKRGEQHDGTVIAFPASRARAN